MSELTPAPNGYPIKLVRDRTTHLIGDEGRLFYDHIPPDERGPWLRKKLVEEVATDVEDDGEVMLTLRGGSGSTRSWRGGGTMRQR